MRELRLHLARIAATAGAHERKYLGRAAPCLVVPRPHRRAWMHELVNLARKEAVIDEEILLDAKARVFRFEVARVVVTHTVPQDEVLGARRRADRIGLHEAQARNGTSEGGGPEQRPA